MTPHHVLRIALANEVRAQQFFESVASSPLLDADTRRLADEFAGEECEHMKIIEQILFQTSPPAIDWHEDLDPPVVVD